MSRQARPVSTIQTICDLCDEAMTDEQPAKTASLVHGYGGTPDRQAATAWYLLWDPRNWPGFRRPTWEEQQRDKKRWAYRHYDFHTECLLRVVEDAIEARTTEPPEEA